MSMSPKQIVAELDRYIIGQADAKRAARARTRHVRHHLTEKDRPTVDIVISNASNKPIYEQIASQMRALSFSSKPHCGKIFSASAALFDACSPLSLPMSCKSAQA